MAELTMFSTILNTIRVAGLGLRLSMICENDENKLVPFWLTWSFENVINALPISLDGSYVSGDSYPAELDGGGLLSTFANSNLFNEVLEQLDIMEDFIWEKLNSKHWKEIHLIHRKLYSYVALLKVLFTSIDTSTCPEQLLRLCDKGILMGAPIFGNALCNIGTLLHRYCKPMSFDSNCFPEQYLPKKSTLPPLIGIRLTLPFLDVPSVGHFRKQHFDTQYPILIRNGIAHWPASRKWNLPYIASVCGHRTVPVEIGSKYTAHDWTQKLMTINQFVTEFMCVDEKECGHDRKPIGYIAQHTLFDQLPELKDDIRIPDYACVGECLEDVDINAWFGPCGTLTPTHHDPKHNLLAQIFGTKFIRLFSPSQSSYLCPNEADSILSNTSQVEMDDAEVLLKWPQLQNISYFEFLLNPGEMLYIPPKWWHLVQSLSPSFSVSFWFN